MKLLNFQMTEKEWHSLRDGFADIACWHKGFRAAQPEYEGPPQLEDASAIVSMMKSQAQKQDAKD